MLVRYYAVFRRCVIILGILFFTIESQAQIQEAIQSVLKTETCLIEQEKIPLSDSSFIDSLQRELEAARLSQANSVLEMEQMRLHMLSRDSIRYKRQCERIDSLRAFTLGVPVVVESDTLFYLYTKRGGYTPQQRAEMVCAQMESIGKRLTVQPDSISIYHTDIVSDIMYRNDVLLSLTDQDAIWEGISRDSLSRRVQQIVIGKLTQMQAEYGLWQNVKRVVILLFILLGQYFLFRLTNYVYKRYRDRINLLKDTKLKPWRVREYELLDTQKQMQFLLFISGTIRYLVMGLLLLITVPLIFAVFPQTEHFAYLILGYLWSPVKHILVGIVDYIPNLFTILVIWITIRYLVRLLAYLAKEIEIGKLKIGGFYSDWALPTFNIIRFLLYAFMIAMIYPYLPGSSSGVFQGISVFVGLMVSLGSSTVIGNIIAGLVITYMRPFKLGDRVRLNETTGNIIEKTPFVTRIRTPKNEVVTIPNSFVMSSHTVNYSESARAFGLIIHSEVTIGYDAPWRQVHQLLIEAALMTDGVQSDPHPFVLETSLSDYYPVYQINAYIKDADRLAQIYSDLHQHIQDCFNRAGVEIMSPHYVATRDGNETTIPKETPL